jgi:hypothetical protein
MNVKEIINNAKTAKLLKENPTVKQVAEIIIGNAVESIITELVDKAEKAILEIKNKSLKGDDGHTPIKGVDYFTDLEIEEIKQAIKPVKGRDYRDGENGKDYELTNNDKREIAKQIDIPIVEKIIEKTPIITEIAKYEEPEAIADKLNTLKEKIEIKVIKGLRDELTNLRRAIKDKKGGGQIGGGGSIVEAEDLSSQCNGANKTFTVGYNIKKVISLTCSQFPIILRRNVDYTFSDKTITLTAEVSAPESGQTLDISYTR